MQNDAADSIEMQTFQMIAEELVLGTLVEKVINSSMQNCGVERVVFMLMQDDQLMIQFQSELAKTTSLLLKTIPVKESDDFLCQAIVELVQRTMQPVRLDDVSHRELFANDPYLQKKQPVSILCLPFVYQTRLIGILYLENKLIKGVFESKQLEGITHLAAQIALCMVNAWAYSELQDNMHRQAEELKWAKQQLIKQERMASLGLLMAGITHEIKNPLNFIINFSELSLERLQELEGLTKKYQAKLTVDDEEVHHLFEDINANSKIVIEQAKNADLIVKRMLGQSVGKSSELVSTNIHRLIEECIALSYHGMRASHPFFSVVFKKEFNVDIGLIKIAPSEMGRVILNLLNNAYDTLNQKKQMEGETFIPTVLIKTQCQAEKLIISIKDNGTGIPEAIVGKIFTPFFTTKPANQGTGLGLSLSKEIVVQQHAGSIQFESREGEFTEFIITLPFLSA